MSGFCLYVCIVYFESDKVFIKEFYCYYYCDHLVCVSVCLSVREHRLSLEPMDRSLRIFCADPCGRGLVLLWRLCDTLCTSGCMDDVTFGRSGPYGDALRYRVGVWCLWMPCHSAPVGVRSILINPSVCMSVCLSVCVCVSVCPRAYLWNR